MRDDQRAAVARPTLPLAGRRRRRKAGDLEALRRELWHAVWRVGELLDDPHAAPADILKAAHALAGLSNAYRGVTETSDTERRLEMIEALLKRSEYR